MVFSSLLFLYVYLPLAVLLYYAAPRRLRNPVLLVLSLAFYGWGEPKWVLLLVFSSVLDFCCSNGIERAREKEPAGGGETGTGKGRSAGMGPSAGMGRQKAWLIASMVGNLGILCFFKYGGFLLESLANVGGAWGIGFLAGLSGTGLYGVLQDLQLPIGISFYTFQTMSCTIDVYRGDARAQKNPIDFATYVTLFPQLIAGPIVRYHQLADQLTGRQETIRRFGSGVAVFAVGLCKKVLLANSFGALWEQVQARSDAPALTALLGIVCFTFQIYFDFSGYSDMAIGLGRLFGFELPVNFNYPYVSRTVTEFWRRWHISLGMWFREYVYIPLGGNRVGTLKLLRNLLVVWFLTGLWHGASWNFVLWGLYYGLILLVEKVFLRKRLEKAPAAVGHLYTMALVIFGWGLFAFTDLGLWGAFVRSLAGANGLADNWFWYTLGTNWPLFLAGILGSTPWPRRWWNRLVGGKTAEVSAAALDETSVEVSPETVPSRWLWLQPVLCVLALLVCTACLVNAGYNPFLYFRF